MRFVENCHTPALVLHGDADVRVPTFQGQEFYKALRLLGRESEYVHYPREPHIFAEREHQIDSLQRIIDWFDSHVK
jgi:dipeptidyl aminopeptidase/acylaminoacyl peptidase